MAPIVHGHVILRIPLGSTNGDRNDVISHTGSFFHWPLAPYPGAVGTLAELRICPEPLAVLTPPPTVVELLIPLLACAAPLARWQSPWWFSTHFQIIH